MGFSESIFSLLATSPRKAFSLAIKGGLNSFWTLEKWVNAGVDPIFSGAAAEGLLFEINLLMVLPMLIATFSKRNVGAEEETSGCTTRLKLAQGEKLLRDRRWSYLNFCKPSKTCPENNCDKLIVETCLHDFLS